MAGHRLSTCSHCGRRFKPCVYNRHHQTYCARPECRSERDKARRRRNYRERIAKDASFHASERIRCRDAMRRLRRKERTLEKAPLAPVSGEVLVGLISQLVDSTDPEVVRLATSAYAERGRRLAVPSRSRSSPGA